MERLWCGFSGRAYATRSQIVPESADAAKGARAVSCARSGDALACR